MEPNVAQNQIWKHTKKGTYYKVAFICNAGNAVDDDNNPPIVVYIPVKKQGEGFVHDMKDMKNFARKLSTWRHSFEMGHD